MCGLFDEGMWASGSGRCHAAFQHITDLLGGPNFIATGNGGDFTGQALQRGFIQLTL